MRRFVSLLCCLSLGLVLAGCQGAAPSAAPARTSVSAPSAAAATASPSSPSPPTVSHAVTSAAPKRSLTPSPRATASVQNVLCAVAFPTGFSDGLHCLATRIKVSTADPAWVFATVAGYNAQGQFATDPDTVIFNQTTRQMIGPTNVGYCLTAQGAPGGSRPFGAYASVPTAVLANFGLAPCPAPATSSAPPSSAPPASVAAFAGTWNAHEGSAVISNAGGGLLKYPDLRACPSCSMATAPVGTVGFVLTSVTGGVATGRITTSSDAKSYAVGLPVRATLMAGHPGELLQLIIGQGNSGSLYCNAAAAGQCGA